jgi:hypothetical protein
MTMAISLSNEILTFLRASPFTLWRMKGFYEVYAPSEKLAPLVREIAWSQNLVITSWASGSDQANYWILEKNTLKKDYFWILGRHF